MKFLTSMFIALGLSLAAYAAPAPKTAAAKAPTAPQGMGKACNPACGAGTYCVDGQCVDNGVKGATTAAPTK